MNERKNPSKNLRFNDCEWSIRALLNEYQVIGPNLGGVNMTSTEANLTKTQRKRA